MDDNKQQTTPEGVTATTSVPDQATSAPTAAPTLAPAQAVPGKKERPFVVGQTMNRGIRESDLVTPMTALEGLTEGPTDAPNVTQYFEYSTPQMPLRDRKDLTGNTEVAFFLSERGKDVDERIRAIVSPNALRTGRGQDWNETIVAAATRTTYLDSRFDETVSRVGSDFKQFLDTESKKLGFTAPSINEGGVGTYRGENAVLRVRSIMGLGGVVSVPLWHSGFWITMQTPEEGAVIELFRRIQEEKIELGRETFGLVFSNEQSYINRFLLEFCLEHVSEHNVKVNSPQELRPLIRNQDLNILFWGMACLIWPRGFEYIRSLTTKEGIENQDTTSAKISVTKLMWVDNSSFDDAHKALLLLRKRGAVSIEQIQEYQRTLIPALAGGRRIEIRPGLEMLIDSTDVDNYIRDGEEWINGIVQTVDSTFTQTTPTEQERNRMIGVHSRASKLRNYGAWVKAFIIDGNENTEREDISSLLNVLSVDDDASELIETEIKKFIDDSSRAVIAIPETSGKETGLPRFPHLIPIDVINTFFTLLAQRVDIIRRR